MQVQATRPDQQQDVMTATKSLQSIQTLLRAGLGCITYLRNLLPTDNFSESYLTSAGADPQPSGHSCSSSFASDGMRRNVSGFKIMTVKRGYTEEADKLMDYLESGIFDALEKQYLRSFIFAIYLDNEDPNNIVEAYTFNFHYYPMPGSDVAVPVMSLGDELTKLSISGKRKERDADPVAEATKNGKVPTLGEVKRSLKSLIKNLIQATTQMDALPRRRFATFKLFYHDHTPDDYEPPHFRAGHPKDDKWFFTTHDRNEVPEKCSVGQVHTGWHGVDMRVASVSGFLPSAEDNNAPFMGTTAGEPGGPPPVLTPVEEATMRKQQVEAQRQDAEERRVVWDAEEGLNRTNSDPDAEGETDDGDDSQLMGIWRMSANGIEYLSPLGMRDDDGKIVPLPDKTEEQCNRLASTQPTTEPTVFKGVQEKVPRHVGQLVLPANNSYDLSQTQKIDSTQLVEEPEVQQHSRENSPVTSPAPPTPVAPKLTTESRVFNSESLPPSDPFPSTIPSVSSIEFEGTIDTQELKGILAGRRNGSVEDSEMLDANTQIQTYTVDDDPIESFSASQAQNEDVDVAMGGIDDAVLECECGVNKEDCDCLLCEGGCHRWFHAWCMGYHSGTSDRIPNKFICFDCRVHADQNWDLIMVHNLYPRMMAKFRDLALFRRAIKICEIQNPESLSAFTKSVGCETIVAGQLFKQLETEGFVAPEDDADEHDVVEARGANRGKTRGRGKGRGGRKPTTRRQTLKQRYAFVKAIVKEKIYEDYFNPDPEVEKRLMGLHELRPKKRAQRNTVPEADVDMDTTEIVDKTTANEAATAQLKQVLLPIAPQDVSQTQAETQLEDEPVEAGDLKRHASSSSDETETGRKTKRVKISIGPAVDLGD